MKFSKTMFALLALFVVIGLSACSKTDTSLPVAPQAATIQDFYLNPGDLAILTDMTDATVEASAALAPPPPDGGTGATPNDPAAVNFGRILRDLQLTETQIPEVRKLMVAREDCVRRLMLMLRKSEMEIMKKSEAARREVAAKLKAGEITREQAQLAMKEINDRTRAALTSNPVRETVQLGIKKCEDDFFAAVGGILDATQLAKWTAFVTKYKELRDKKRPSIGTRP